MPKRNRRPKQARLYASYQVQITSWEWTYTFGVNASCCEDTQYADHRHLYIHGTLLRPRTFKIETVKLTFHPEQGLADLQRQHDEPPPPSVGSLNIQDAQLTGYLFIPMDALAPLLQMLLADRFKYVLLDGERMRYRKALIHRFEMTAHYDEADYLDDN
jgi:hypothetical protein